ncbi:MAG: hypothetical protein HC840_11895 [Leptolyngbyaceae cyanobacterium RM2_2_4]|nr:hypothetical protein [Leptolyngbyaceae cyanobacterium SM1_4_3]NJN91904.1 hypothetical protein [Leptolyngbyaceae cyanobacterium SL_5_14]NJO50018.1 hypothetical protein [Leptolyngbyaceae cyanobacterium RM2_2_4]
MTCDDLSQPANRLVDANQLAPNSYEQRSHLHHRHRWRVSTVARPTGVCPIRATARTRRSTSTGM